VFSEETVLAFLEVKLSLKSFSHFFDLSIMTTEDGSLESSGHIVCHSPFTNDLCEGFVFHVSDSEERNLVLVPLDVPVFFTFFFVPELGHDLNTFHIRRNVLRGGGVVGLVLLLIGFEDPSVAEHKNRLHFIVLSWKRQSDVVAAW
jgi:hypothetical protein